MGRLDWCRRKTWSEIDQREFWARWQRSRGKLNKAQYLRLQADALSESAPDVALELLGKMVNEFPESLEIGMAELLRAQIYLGKGNLAAGLAALERTFAHQVSCPNIITQAWWVYGRTVIQNKLTNLYDSAEKRVLAYESHAVFPLDRFHIHAILAVINEHRKESAAATEHARQALAQIKIRHSGFRRHPDVGLVENPDKQLVAQLKAIAHRKSWYRFW